MLLNHKGIISVQGSLRECQEIRLPHIPKLRVASSNLVARSITQKASPSGWSAATIGFSFPGRTYNPAGSLEAIIALRSSLRPSTMKVPSPTA